MSGANPGWRHVGIRREALNEDAYYHARAEAAGKSLEDFVREHLLEEPVDLDSPRGQESDASLAEE
jgi:hypothetical protein